MVLVADVDMLADGAAVGPYAVVGEGTEIGPGATLEAHVVVGRRCRVGAGARLHPHVVLYDDVSIGPGTEVHAGAVLGADGFGYVASPTGLKKVPQVGGVEVGSGVEIGANTCIDRADQALYRAKSEGRDRTVIADPPPPQVGATGTQRLAAAH